MTFKRLLLSLGLLCVLLPLSLHAETNRFSSTEEYIQEFDTTIVVNRDSSINTTEDIVYHFAEGDQKHGIYRDIPLTYESTLGTKFKLHISNIHVTDEKGIPYSFAVSSIEDGKTRIKIGDPDTLIQERIHM